MSSALLLCSGTLTAQRPSRYQWSWTPYLLVVLHIVAQTDQTGFELLCHQGPAVVLRFSHAPNDKSGNMVRVNPISMQKDGMVTSYEIQRMRDGGWRDRQTSRDVKTALACTTGHFTMTKHNGHNFNACMSVGLHNTQ